MRMNVKFGMKIKLFTSFMAIVILFFVSIVFNHYLTRQIMMITNQILLNNQMLSYVQKIDYEVRTSDDNGAWFLMSTSSAGGNSLYEKYHANVTQVNVDLTKLDSMSAGLPDYTALKSFNVEWNLYQSDNNVTFQVFKTGHREEAQKMYMQVPLDPVLSPLISYTNDRINENKALISSLSLQTERINLINWGIAVMAIVIGVIIAWILSMQISNTAKLVRSVAVQVADGDLTIERIVPKTSDELSDVINAMNTMVERLRHLIKEVEGAVARVAGTAEELNSFAGDATGATNQIAVSMQQLAVGSEEQLASTKNSTSILNEVGVKVQKIAHSSSEVSQFALLTAQVAESGNESVYNTLMQIKSIHLSVTSTAEMIADLRKQSDQIRSMVGVITNIADETNLLALNATIEAAHAGEHGAGFAVVADEVRRLAVGSSESAKEIIQTSNHIRDVAIKSVTAMEKITFETLGGLEVAQKAINSFEQIRDSAKQVSLQIQSVSAETSQINTDIHQVNQAFDHVSGTADKASVEVKNVVKATEEQLNYMAEIASSANLLSQLARNLQSMVGSFKMNRDKI